MHYIDPYNYPKESIRNYPVVGGVVEPDLFHGAIFRITADDSFEIGRLVNQIDGAKLFVEVYNEFVRPIYVSFDSDYVAINGGTISPLRVEARNVLYFELICRMGLMIIYNQIGSLSGNYLLNPADGSILRNPATGEPLLKVG